MTSETDQICEPICRAVSAGSLVKAVLSKPVGGKNAPVRRIDVRPIKIRGQSVLQFTSKVGNQEIHQNLPLKEAVLELTAAIKDRFRDCLIRTHTEEWTIRFSKKGKCSVRQTAVKTSDAAPAVHNKPKQYLIPDNEVVPFLVATGVMSPAGRVVAKHYRKFRQINRYVEFIRDIVPRLPSDGTLRIVDFGSGKSYLTFAVHYFLTQTLQRQVQITGLDRRPDVIESCRQIVAQLSLAGIDFAVGDIASFSPDEEVHLAISLHACDTATDDALATAVSWNADVILAVPCCHHELASGISRQLYPLISEHGILHERFCELTTDAIRANLLGCVGYNASVVEFIDLEHTARNILIRACRRSGEGVERQNQEYRQRLNDFSSDFGLPVLRLQRMLEEYGQLTDSTETSAPERQY